MEGRNEKEFRRIAEEESWLAAAYTGAIESGEETIVIPGFVTELGSLLSGTVGVKLAWNRIQKLRSLLRNGQELDETFREREIEITLDLAIPDHGRLDLLVRFPLPPKKAIFAIALRRQGGATILYREDREGFYIRRQSGKINPWFPDHIERLGVQGFWLRQNREELFGTSRSDRNRPLVKLLVLTGETKIAKHSDSLYVEIGDQRILLIKRQSSIYVLRELQLLPFMQAWLTPLGQ